MFELVTAIIILLLLIFIKRKEHFIELVKTPFKKTCGACGKFGPGRCLVCKNCGICTTPSGIPECTEGDKNGPIFRKDCVSWSYGNPSVTSYTYGYPRYWHSRYGYPRHRYYKGIRYW